MSYPDDDPDIRVIQDRMIATLVRRCVKRGMSPDDARAYAIEVLNTPMKIELPSFEDL